MLWGFTVAELVSISVTLVNMIIRTINIYLIKLVGYHSTSRETSVITETIFLATFLNTAWVLLLGNANLQSSHLKFIPLDGAYVDMTQGWYLDIGPALVSTMVINSVYVYCDFAIAWGTKWLFRSLDQGGCCCCKKRVTKLTTIQAYVNLYSGPPHSMNYKYSLILTTVFVTFMFGLALPLLFPIAAFTFLNLYICERVLVTYFHPRPPTYDDKLNTQTLSAVRWAPVFLLFFGYWFVGQPQIFNNNAPVVTSRTEVPQTDHNAAPDTGPELSMFVVSLIVVPALFFESCLKGLLAKLKLMSPEEEVEVDEKLGTYYECVPAGSRRNLIAEEAYRRGKLNIKTMSDANFEKARVSRGLNKLMTPPMNYHLEVDTRYRQSFVFTPV